MGDKRRGSAERWKARLGTGVPFGLAMGIFDYVRDGSWWRAAITAVFTGAFFGAFMGRWTVRQRREATAETGVPDGRWTQSELRAGMREPGAAPPELQDDLRRLLRYRLAMAGRGRRRQLITFVVIGTVSVCLAVLSSPWWWFTVVVWAVMIGVVLADPARLRRKLALLGDTGVELPG